MKELIGTVVNNKMEKTASVEVKRTFRHSLYKKILTRSKKYKVHDELGVQVGDTVKIQETKPISKEKHFKVIEVIKHVTAA